MDTNSNIPNTGKTTFAGHVSKSVGKVGDYLEIELGGNKLRFLYSTGLGYVLTLQFIAPLLKDIFLIATWGNIFLIYFIAIVIGIMITIFYSMLTKILLYLFS